MSDAFDIPVAAKPRFCATLDCGKRLALMNTGELCFGCRQRDRDHRIGEMTRKAKRTPYIPLTGANADPCPHGCGKLRHRGLCHEGWVVRRPVMAAVSTPATSGRFEVDTKVLAARVKDSEERSFVDTVKGRIMDELKSKTVRIADIPETAKPSPTVHGRLGALWIKLQALTPGMAESVENRNREHANNTLSHMRQRAKKAGLRLVDKRDGTTLHLWLVKAEGK